MSLKWLEGLKIWCDGCLFGAFGLAVASAITVHILNPSVLRELLSWLEQTDGGRLAQELRVNPTLSAQVVQAMHGKGMGLDNGIHIAVVRSPYPRNGDNDRILLLRFIDGNAITLMNVRGSAGPQPRDPIHPDFEPYGGKAFIMPGQYSYQVTGETHGEVFTVGVPTSGQKGNLRIAFDVNNSNTPDSSDIMGTDQSLGVFGVHGPGTREGRSITSAGCIVFASEDDAKTASNHLEGQPTFYLAILDGGAL